MVPVKNFLLKLCLFSSHPSPSVLIPALRTVGNIVTGDDLQTQVLVGLGLDGLFLSHIDLLYLQGKESKTVCAFTFEKENIC